MKQTKNIEIKAKCNDLSPIRQILLENKADFKGTDHQVDTYFNAVYGRLKLREGNIENNLIHYNRPDQSGPKQSDFSLFKTKNGSGLKDLLSKALGVKIVVDKKREIYFIDQVKFHLDTVKGLGTFIEIEVIDMEGDRSLESMNVLCQIYLKLFGVHSKNLIEHSYSDMILSRNVN